MVEGKIALVTGAGRGIGRAIALTLARHGADVVVNDMMVETAEAAAEAVRQLGRRALAAPGNITDPKQCKEMVEQAVTEFSRLDILVNNAGITRDQLIVGMKDEDWDLVLNVNLKGAFNCIRAALRPMSRQRFGRIINIASVVGIMGNIGQANYAASKGGLIALTKTVAREMASRNITCNAVAPGFIQTDMTASLKPEIKEAILKQIPVGRMGLPDEVAACVLFLASDLAAYVTGHVLVVDGGMAM
ncbi:MAG: 3-oxoacyl-[acyl-carrier-protein] reductase [Candidatus Sumerlaeia bacterium]|nr:3-oxoacyl-[acyl-carrier-protein] reductase [Candidatus Sumerlaeia bacterium]